MIWDARRRCQRKTGIIVAPIHLPNDERQIYLVVSRPGVGRKSWYLITTEPVYNAEQAWQIVLAYAKRWQIEMSLRFTKSELAFESPRLHSWEARLKFLLIAALAIELESGAEMPQFHFIACVWLLPSFGSMFAFTPCLP